MLNAILFCLVVPYQVRRLLQPLWCRPPPDEDTQLVKRTRIGEESSRLSWRKINHTVLNICLFPPLFFFSVLYYTDVLSASCVLATYIVFRQRHQKTNATPKNYALVQGSIRRVSWLQAYYRAVPSAHNPWATDIWLCALGLYALLFRQTNIFWVAIFLAGLEVIRVVKLDCATSWEGADNSLSGILREGWYHGKIYDPLVREASIEGSKPLNISSIYGSDPILQMIDYLKTTISLAIGTAANLNTVLVSITPYIFFLLAFGSFVLWNGGVVLGE